MAAVPYGELLRNGSWIRGDFLWEGQPWAVHMPVCTAKHHLLRGDWCRGGSKDRDCFSEMQTGMYFILLFF